MKTNILILLVAMFLGNTVFAQDVLVITNKDNDAKSLSSTELKQIFLAQKQTWGSGEPIQLAVNSEDKKLIGDFAKLIGMDEASYSNAWIKITLSGKSPPPFSASNDNDTLDFVKKNKGAIGFITPAAKTGDVAVVDVK